MELWSSDLVSWTDSPGTPAALLSQPSLPHCLIPSSSCPLLALGAPGANMVLSKLLFLSCKLQKKTQKCTFTYDGGTQLVSPKLLLFPFNVKHSVSSLGFISNSTKELNKVALSQELGVLGSYYLRTFSSGCGSYRDGVSFPSDQNWILGNHSS